MNTNIRILKQVCQEAGVDYQELHGDGNLISLKTPKGVKLFVNRATPLNSESIADICEDKGFCYALLGDSLPMPLTKAYLDPQTDEKYKPYLHHDSIDNICDDIERYFKFPLIVKKNRGSFGCHVFRVDNPSRLRDRLMAIFDATSKNYDYIALAQAHVDISSEYRAVFFRGKLIFAYLGDTSQAQFSGNLSPFYWTGAKAILVEDSELLGRLEQTIAPALLRHGILYAGVDVVEDTQGQLWVLELNSSPGFDSFVRDCGDDAVSTLFRVILDRLMADD